MKDLCSIAVTSFFLPQGKPAFKAGSLFLVACSGGPDSVALVRTLKRMEKALPYQFVLVHVNHKLRGKESDGDANFVQALAKRMKWPLRIVNAPVRITKGNLEETAREKRYETFRKLAQQLKIKTVLTAHTQDDQAETIMMNIMRGTGPDGLTGMKALRESAWAGLAIGRPFLGLSKKDILNELMASGQAYRSDRTNKDEGFLRNWLRSDILPRLESRAPGFQRRLLQLGDLLREEQAYWKNVITEIKPRVLRKYRGGALLDFKKLLSYPAAAQRRFLRHELGGDLMSFEAIENLRRWMSAPPTSGRQWQLRKGWVAERLSRSNGAPSAWLFWLRKSRKSKRNPN